MHFLPDVYVNCEVCHGQPRITPRHSRSINRGKTIADVPEHDHRRGHALLRELPARSPDLKAVNDVGLGYVKLGQPSTQLSGGEAQRVKLATELGKSATGHTLYVLDGRRRPALCDIHNLLTVLNRLADMGNTILVIEHNLDVISSVPTG